MSQDTGQLRFGEYMLGLEGLALLRMGVSGDVSAAPERVEEMLDLAARLDEEVLAASRYLPASGVQPGYDVWANTYDDRDNPLIRTEEPALVALFQDLPEGPVLDAACGTGRLASLLTSRHRVIGVDNSPEMLGRARKKSPQAEFLDGDLGALPVETASVTSAVCALALSHLPELGRAVKELARVVAPGGRVVISNVHPIVTGVLGGGRGSLIPTARAPSSLSMSTPMPTTSRRSPQPNSRSCAVWSRPSPRSLLAPWAGAWPTTRPRSRSRGCRAR